MGWRKLAPVLTLALVSLSPVSAFALAQPFVQCEPSTLRPGSRLSRGSGLGLALRMSGGKDKVFKKNPVVGVLGYLSLLPGDPRVVLNTGDGTEAKVDRPDEEVRKAITALYGGFVKEDGTGVDYAALEASQEFADFVRLSASLKSADPAAMSTEVRLAFFINVYNTLVHAPAPSPFSPSCPCPCRPPLPCPAAAGAGPRHERTSAGLQVIHAVVALGTPANLLSRLRLYATASYKSAPPAPRPPARPTHASLAPRAQHRGAGPLPERDRERLHPRQPPPAGALGPQVLPRRRPPPQVLQPRLSPPLEPLPTPACASPRAPRAPRAPAQGARRAERGARGRARRTRASTLRSTAGPAAARRSASTPRQTGRLTPSSNAPPRPSLALPRPRARPAPPRPAPPRAAARCPAGSCAGARFGRGCDAAPSDPDGSRLMSLEGQGGSELRTKRVSDGHG
jgi:hypothetical protein